MISESDFNRNDFRRLQDLRHTRLLAEMAVISEWVVRDGLHPDHLLTVYVSPIEDGTIAAACACPEGASDRTCLHALLVITTIKENGHLLRELFAKRSNAAA